TWGDAADPKGGDQLVDESEGVVRVRRDAELVVGRSSIVGTQIGGSGLVEPPLSVVVVDGLQSERAGVRLEQPHPTGYGRRRRGAGPWSSPPAAIHTPAADGS